MFSLVLIRVDVNESEEVFHEVGLAILNLPFIPQDFQDCVAVIKIPRLRFTVGRCNRELILDAVKAEHGLDSDVNLAAETHSFKVYPIVACVPLVDEITVRHNVTPSWCYHQLV
jgi:hypothetical protein